MPDFANKFANDAAGAAEGAVKGGVKGAAKQAAGMGGPDAGGAGVAAPWASEVGFLKQYTALMEAAQPLLPMALAVANISGPLGKVEEALRGVKNANKARTDYPLDEMERDAAALESLSRDLAAAAPGVSGLLAQLSAVVAQSTAAAPKNETEVEKELWIRWVASLSHQASSDLMDEDLIENHLRALGIWDQLGVEESIGSWFSDADEALAICSARAQEKILAHRGESVEVHLTGRQPTHPISLADVPPVPAVMDDSGTASSPHVNAVVVGARTDTLDTSVLKKAPFNKDAISEYLLRNGHVYAVLRAYEDLAPEPEAPPP
jgi:hypothetical protein